MKYFHRAAVAPDTVVARAAEYFGARLSPLEEAERRLRFAGVLGELAVRVEAEGGHYTLVTVETNQPGESELDKLAKRFLGMVHALDEPRHLLRGSY